jgi:hypothetical protein
LCATPDDVAAPASRRSAWKSSTSPPPAYLSLSMWHPLPALFIPVMGCALSWAAVMRSGHLSPSKRCMPLMRACGAISTVSSRQTLCPRRANKQRQPTTSLENAHGQTVRSALGVFVFARVLRFVVHLLNVKRPTRPMGIVQPIVGSRQLAVVAQLLSVESGSDNSLEINELLNAGVVQW